MRIIINKSEFSISVPMFSSVFPGGEEHIRLDFKEADQMNLDDIRDVTISVRIINSSLIIKMIMAINAIRNHFTSAGVSNIKINLIAPYFPYARQDRVCVNGEALSVKVFADLINSQKLNSVEIWDAHSDVTLAVLNKVKHVTQLELISNFSILHNKLINKEYTLLSPDAGAMKKTLSLAKNYNITDVIQAEKVRNLATGEIMKTVVHGDIKGKNILIVDDICDGGRTFIEIAKILKEHNASKVSLYVTHGIFSKGFDVFNGLIDTIYTTNSFQKFKHISSMIHLEVLDNKFMTQEK